MAKKKTTRTRKTVNVLTTLGDIAGSAVVIDQFARGATGAAVKSGNMANLPLGLMQDAKALLVPTTAMKIVGPPVATRIASKIVRSVGVRPGRVLNSKFTLI